MLIDRATKGQTETILFNIDIEGFSNKDKTAVLRVFAKMTATCQLQGIAVVFLILILTKMTAFNINCFIRSKIQNTNISLCSCGLPAARTTCCRRNPLPPRQPSTTHQNHHQPAAKNQHNPQRCIHKERLRHNANKQIRPGI